MDMCFHSKEIIVNVHPRLGNGPMQFRLRSFCRIQKHVGCADHPLNHFYRVINNIVMIINNLPLSAPISPEPT